MVASGPASHDGDTGVVALERRRDGVALVTLERPKMNALSVAFLGRLRDVVIELADDPPGAVVLWGGPRIFAAGADVGEFREPDAAARIATAFHGATTALAALPRVTIAAITGYALGGGLELALACDLRVVSEDARLGQPEILLGIVPGGGATQRLPRLVGLSRGKDMMFTGRQVGADEALRIGLADRVVPPDMVLDEALALAAGFAAGPLEALAAAKRVIDDGLDEPLAQALELEVAAFVAVSHTEDAATGVTSFLEHGPGRARFAGR
ncbi:MAG TPA: enoyl-CoA hydratase/isomerase family protein [Acidimicrobiales bacterium]|nr:enoyl-CoA hydratase/isomerase family protein [Acidimicrobiales bacterium]